MPRRNLEHVKDHVHRVENEPADNQVQQGNANDTSLLQLLEEFELDIRVMLVPVFR